MSTAQQFYIQTTTKDKNLSSSQISPTFPDQNQMKGRLTKFLWSDIWFFIRRILKSTWEYVQCSVLYYHRYSEKFTSHIFKKYYQVTNDSLTHALRLTNKCSLFKVVFKWCYQVILILSPPSQPCPVEFSVLTEMLCMCPLHHSSLQPQVATEYLESV